MSKHFFELGYKEGFVSGAIAVVALLWLVELAKMVVIAIIT